MDHGGFRGNVMFKSLGFCGAIVRIHQAVLLQRLLVLRARSTCGPAVLGTPRSDTCPLITSCSTQFH
ncbi:unnamed protein product [Hermetia illucens]|uniref:Uncharacterized protein n=1 Tax=Hermetia illucens TaxID=343691 RepID=A0A7R8U9Y4_HERIL|nr:unnamed protein product [Hermetia illucens]